VFDEQTDWRDEPPIPWLTPRCWALAKGKTTFEQPSFQARILAADLLVALLGIILAVSGLEVWRRRRPGKWQITLVELGVGISLLAILLAWWRQNSSAYHQERPHIVAIEEGGGIEVYDRHVVLTAYRGPVWLSRLTGSTPKIFDRADTVILRPSREGELLELIPHLSALRELRMIEFDQDYEVTASLVEVLRKMPQLRVLDFSHSFTFDAEAITHLQDLQHILEVDVRGTSVTPSDVAILRKQMPQCTIISD
jgi:hypothetical protein